MSEEKQDMTRKEFLKVAAVGVGAVAGILSGAKSPRAASGSRLVMVIDLRRCIGCRACTVACKKEMSKPLGVFNSAVKQVDSPDKFPKMRKHFMPILCNHCDDPPCVSECPRTGKATFKRADGAVLYNKQHCIGCYACVEVCPYGARHVDPTVAINTKDPENENPVGIGKCEFCYHRIDNGVVPACVNTCQAKARVFGDLNDPGSEVAKLIKSVKAGQLLPNEGTKPQVYYIDPKGVLGMSKFGSTEKEERYKDVVI